MWLIAAENFPVCDRSKFESDLRLQWNQILTKVKHIHFIRLFLKQTNIFHGNVPRNRPTINYIVLHCRCIKFTITTTAIARKLDIQPAIRFISHPVGKLHHRPVIKSPVVIILCVELLREPTQQKTYKILNFFYLVCCCCSPRVWTRFDFVRSVA